MEQTQLYQARLNTLKEAIIGFVEAVQQDIDSLEPIMQDLVRNGQVQKFEYCTEFFWKTMKLYLSLYEGLEERSPKAVIKAFFRTQKISSALYESMIQMIDHRNLFSHVYNQDQFLELWSYLPEHAKVMKEVLNILTQSRE